ncbi:MAG: polysaccharide deacetylase family protein [Negativicutes bacterium]|nr:polysaccharide deacetylase family protein [Negativicutes bacterium]
MKWHLIISIPRWYAALTLGFFVAVASLAGVVKCHDLTAANSEKIRPIYQGNASQPIVAFACNVFWGEEFLPQMLDTFDKEQVKITFFIGGSWAKRYPHVLKEIANHGHEIGNHSYSHPHPARLTKQKNQEQIIKTEQLITEIAGIKTRLYAPPYGEFNDTVLQAAHELGYTTIMWTIDTIDWKRPPAEVLQNRVLTKLQNGAIILMHPTDPTAKALPGLIQQIKSKGYQISTVSSILK